MIAILLGVMMGAALTVVMDPLPAFLVGLFGALLMIAYTIGQAVHDVRNSGGQ